MSRYLKNLGWQFIGMGLGMAALIGVLYAAGYVVAFLFRLFG